MEEKKVAPVRHKRKVAKGPNPLSMKKKTVKNDVKKEVKVDENGESGNSALKKRSKKRRVKLSAHAKMAVLNKMQELTRASSNWFQLYKNNDEYCSFRL